MRKIQRRAVRNRAEQGRDRQNSCHREKETRRSLGGAPQKITILLTDAEKKASAESVKRLRNTAASTRNNNALFVVATCIRSKATGHTTSTDPVVVAFITEQTLRETFITLLRCWCLYYGANATDNITLLRSCKLRTLYFCCACCSLTLIASTATTNVSRA